MNYFRAAFFISLLAAILIPAASRAAAQTAPDEHSGHHPPQEQTSPMPASNANANTNASTNANTNVNTNASGGMTNGAGNGTSGGMMGGMGEMMKQMGNPRKEIYPSLMALPDLPTEKREEIKKFADEQVNEGNTALSAGLNKLTDATKNQDFAQMQAANDEIRLGQTLLANGLAAQRALAENKDSRAVALEWFKKEMKLAPAAQIEQPRGFFGLSWFHYITMLTLAAFSAAMIWMYFRKMKRADALVAKLAGGANNTPLPTASPPASPPPTSDVKPAAVNPAAAPSKPNSWSGTLRVAAIFDETPQVKTFRLTDPSGGKLPFDYLPGQFVTVAVVPDKISVKRSYTIASSPTRQDYCEITVKHEERGTVSHYLNNRVHAGDLLQMTAPSGKFTFTEQEDDSIILIAGGVGVTPLMSIIRYLTDRSWKGDIYFFFGCWDESNIIFREEIEYLKKRYPNLHVCIILEEPPDNSENSYLSGRITKEILARRAPEIASHHIHICGPPPMIEAVKQMLDELEVPKENVRTEIFGAKPPAPKTSPIAPEEDGKSRAPEEADNAPIDGTSAQTAVATFAKSNKTAALPPDKSILEASEDVGVNIDYSCRVGVCGICKVKLLSGKVTMAVEEALTSDDKTQNIILACQAKAVEDVAVDA